MLPFLSSELNMNDRLPMEAPAAIGYQLSALSVSSRAFRPRIVGVTDGYFAGTRRFSSSAQFSTTCTMVTGLSVDSMGRSRRNRWPSALTSQPRMGVVDACSRGLVSTAGEACRAGTETGRIAAEKTPGPNRCWRGRGVRGLSRSRPALFLRPSRSGSSRRDQGRAVHIHFVAPGLVGHMHQCPSGENSG